MATSSSGKVQFTQEQGDQAAKRLDHAHNVIRALQVRLGGHHDELSKNWQSSNAKPAFDAVFTEFNEDFTKILAKLKEMHHKLSKTTLNYSDNEQQQVQIVNRMHQLLNGNTSFHNGNLA